MGCHTARSVAGMRADALRQWGSARSRFKRTVGVRRAPFHWKSCLIPLIHGLELVLVCFRCGIPAAVVSFLLVDCTFCGWDASRRTASIGQREVQIRADGGRAAWRTETMQIVCDFSAADGFRRDAHIDIQREAQP
jgi:hypothetical protein